MKRRRFGLLHVLETPERQPQDQAIGENLDIIQRADALDFDVSWLAEHHFSDYGILPAPAVFGAFAAARTRRLRIGSAVTVLPFQHPVRVAEEFALLDVLSGGRIELGVGRGYQPHEFDGYGVAIADSRDRFDESLTIIRKCFTTPSFDFDGRFFRLRGVRLTPTPVQQPHPPIWLAAWNPESIRYIAATGANLLFSPLMAGPSALDPYRTQLAPSIGGLVFAFVDPDRERAYREFERPCMWYFARLMQNLPAERFHGQDGYYANVSCALAQQLELWRDGRLSFRDIVERGPASHAFLVGDPVQVRAKLAALLELYPAMTDVLLWMRVGGLALDHVIRSMELFMTEVVARTGV